MDNLLKIKSVKNITVDDLSNNYKLIYITKFQNAFTKDLLDLTKIDPKTNKKVRKNKEELCKEIGISDTTLKRYMKDLGMKSFYRHEHSKTYVKSKNIKKENNQDDNKSIEKNNKKGKSKKKYEIKGGMEAPDKIENEEYDYNETFNKTIDGLKTKE